MKKLFCLVFLLFAASTAAAMEGPPYAAGCHCFKERTFDPQQKFAADGYLLTTSFNSLIAKIFRTSKRQIVMMKMKGGVHPDDLLIGLYVSRAGGVSFNSLLAMLHDGGTWKQILESGNMQGDEGTEKVFRSIIAAGDNKTEAVEAVTDQLLQDFFAISETDIAGLRKEGAGGREINLVYLLERYGKGDKKAADILSMYTAEKKSWGEIALSFGLSPKETGKLLGGSSEGSFP